MRLFYAVNFPMDVKDRLAGLQEGLRPYLERGRYTLYDNLHLTLVFLGEVPEGCQGVLFDITDRLRFEPFELSIRGLGRFRREGGDIVWAGITDSSPQDSAPLQGVYERLSNDVRRAGFVVESRRYTPHLTLVRDARFKEGFSLTDFAGKTDPITAPITKVSLMKSERLSGRLTYTAIR
jgi:2'-5' RNA ligase